MAEGLGTKRPRCSDAGEAAGSALSEAAIPSAGGVGTKCGSGEIHMPSGTEPLLSRRVEEDCSSPGWL